MKILLTNDDGFGAPGLHAVAEVFSGEHEILVVAPDLQRSAASQAITLPPNIITCRMIDGYDYKVYAVGGSPADCIKVALSALGVVPELVISGINAGQNLGGDVWYSGTVSAAADAASFDYRAIALSLCGFDRRYSDYLMCAEFIKKNLSVLMSLELPNKTLLNINFPDELPRGAVITKTNTQKTFVDRHRFFDNGDVSPGGERDYSELDGESDEYFCLVGKYITISPIMLDRTDYITLNKIRDSKLIL